MLRPLVRVLLPTSVMTSPLHHTTNLAASMLPGDTPHPFTSRNSSVAPHPKGVTYITQGEGAAFAGLHGSSHSTPALTFHCQRASSGTTYPGLAWNEDEMRGRIFQFLPPLIGLHMEKPCKTRAPIILVFSISGKFPSLWASIFTCTGWFVLSQSTPAWIFLLILSSLIQASNLGFWLYDLSSYRS